MFRNLDSSAFIQSLQQTVNGLIQPLEQAQWMMRNNGYYLPSAFETLGQCFQIIGYHFAQLDGKVSEEEIAFTEDLLVSLGKNNLGMVSNQQLVHYANQMISYNPNFFQHLSIPPAVEYLRMYDVQFGTDFATQAKSMYFKFANAVAKTDGTVSPTELESLERFQQLLFNNGPLPDDIKTIETPTNKTVTNRTSDQQNDTNSSIIAPPVVPPPENKDEQKTTSKPDFVRIPEAKTETISLEETLEKLDALIGLEKVKTEVKQLINLLKVQQLRKETGLPAYTTSKHLVFSGNPGTGKTTVARLLANVYKSLEVVSKGQFVETDRAGLIAGYIGQTAIQVKAVVETAIGGVFFIDEAYALTSNEHGWDFGHEAVDTIVKLMEDNRDNLIVIVAGYTEKMQQFLDSNPGLRSRFNKYMVFDDYTPEQLLQIFKKFCKDTSYQLNDAAIADLTNLFTILYESRDETFGNARLARNLFEMTINNHSSRVAKIGDINIELLSTIEQSDIPRLEELPKTKTASSM